MRRAVEAYVDGELGPDVATEVARHLSSCWECSTVAETLRLLKQALRQQRCKRPATVAEHRLRRFAAELAAQHSHSSLGQ